MPPKGRTPSRSPRRRPKVAGHGPGRPTTAITEPADQSTASQTTTAPADRAAAPPATTQPVDRPIAPADRGSAPPAEAPPATRIEQPAVHPASATDEPATGVEDDRAADEVTDEAAAEATGDITAETTGGTPAETTGEATADAVTAKPETPERQPSARSASGAAPPISARQRTGLRRSTAKTETDTRRPKPERSPRSQQQEQLERKPAHRRWVQIVLLVLVIMLFGTLGAWFRGQADRASTGAANNRAVVDTGANAEVVGQISKAVETVLSYDHTKLDDNEQAAREVITGKYVEEYNVTFADIRKTATEQKVTLTTTVLLAGVKHLSGDRAELIATMDLASVRNGTPANAPGRVRVVASRVDGRWKIAEMTLM